MKEVFKLTKGKAATVLFLLLIWMVFFGINKSCSLMARACYVDENNNGMFEPNERNNEISAKSLPFLLSCKQTCGEEEYNSELKKAWANFIILKTIIPLIIIYIGFCLVNGLFRKPKIE